MGSDGHYYSQEQIREVVAYAADRGIRVIPEFDMPGHTRPGLPAILNWPAAPGPYQIARDFGIFDPVLDPTPRRRLTNSWTNLSARWRRCFPTPISTSAATR